MLRGELPRLTLLNRLVVAPAEALRPGGGGNTAGCGPINTISASALAEGQIATAVRRCAPYRLVSHGGGSPFSRERYQSECWKLMGDREQWVIGCFPALSQAPLSQLPY
jgi:hypothetical protein